MVAGIIKGFNFTMDYVLYELSYANMIMLGAVLPSYDSKRNKEKRQDVINASDPRNKDKVKAFFDNIKY